MIATVRPQDVRNYNGLKDTWDGRVVPLCNGAVVLLDVFFASGREILELSVKAVDATYYRGLLELEEYASETF